MKTDLELLLNLFEEFAIDAANDREEVESDDNPNQFAFGLYRGQEIAYDSAIRQIKRILDQHF